MVSSWMSPTLKVFFVVLTPSSFPLSIELRKFPTDATTASSILTGSLQVDMIDVRLREIA